MKTTLTKFLMAAGLIFGLAGQSWSQQSNSGHDVQRPSERPASAPATLEQLVKPGSAPRHSPERFDPQTDAFRPIDQRPPAAGEIASPQRVTNTHVPAAFVTTQDRPDQPASGQLGDMAGRFDEVEVPAVLSGRQPGEADRPTSVTNPLTDSAGASAHNTASGPSAAGSPQPAGGSGWPSERTASLPAGPFLEPIAPPSVSSGQRADGQPEVARATAQIAGPSLVVESFGPGSTMINRVATYEVRVSNMGSRNAASILVGVDFPEWIEIESTNNTNGQTELSDDGREARVIWTVAGVPAGGHQTLKLNLIPRQADPFDLALEWTMVPMSAKTPITVTEPKLDLRIVAPEDVLYGQLSNVEVVVTNPGTGMAENVEIKLSEELSGQRVKVGNLPPGQERKLRIDWPARKEGELLMAATATAADNLEDEVEHTVLVRRGKLELGIQTARLHYSGSNGLAEVTVRNIGNADAVDVFAAVALPPSVKFVEGVEQVEMLDGGVRWRIGTMAPGAEKTFKLVCQMGGSGDMRLEAAAIGEGDLAASDSMMMRIETIAEVVLTVEDPRGPMPTAEDVVYTVRIVNRGTKSASNVDLVMQFSDGIEPIRAEGLEHRLVPGQVLFSPIPMVEPGQEKVIRVIARANTVGAHRFRAEVTCSEPETHAVAEGTTRFFEKEIASSTSSTSGATRTAEQPADDGRPRR